MEILDTMAVPSLRSALTEATGSMDLDLSSSKNPVGHIPSWAGQGWVSPVSLAASARWVPLPGGDG